MNITRVCGRNLAAPLLQLDTTPANQRRCCHQYKLYKSTLPLPGPRSRTPSPLLLLTTEKEKRKASLQGARVAGRARARRETSGRVGRAGADD